MFSGRRCTQCRLEIPAGSTSTESRQVDPEHYGEELPHDEFSHSEEAEGRPRNQVAADFGTSKKSGRASPLLPLLPLLPLVIASTKPTARLIPGPGYQSGSRVCVAIDSRLETTLA